MEEYTEDRGPTQGIGDPQALATAGYRPGAEADVGSSTPARPGFGSPRRFALVPGLPPGRGLASRVRGPGPPDRGTPPGSPPPGLRARPRLRPHRVRAHLVVDHVVRRARLGSAHLARGAVHSALRLPVLCRAAYGTASPHGVGSSRVVDCDRLAPWSVASGRVHMGDPSAFHRCRIA